jgi:hypothetical protein
VFRCAAQQHSFNVPHQLTSLRTLLEIEDSVQVDVPDAALVGNICLREGGILHGMTYLQYSKNKNSNILIIFHC